MGTSSVSLSITFGNKQRGMLLALPIEVERWTSMFPLDFTRFALGGDPTTGDLGTGDENAPNPPVNREGEKGMWSIAHWA